MGETYRKVRRPALIPEEALSQEEVEGVQQRCIGDPPPQTDSSSQQPILQDPFHHSRVDSRATAVCDSTIDEPQPPNRQRYHCNSNESENIPPPWVVNRDPIHGESSSSRRKVRKFSSRNIVSSRHHLEDSEDRARGSQEEFVQYPGANSNNILHTSEIPPDAVFPMTSYGVSMWSNVGDSNGPIADERDIEHCDLPPIMSALSPEDILLRLRT